LYNPCVSTGHTFKISGPSQQADRETDRSSSAREEIEMPLQTRRVQVWFGTTAIADYIAPEEQANRYQDAMTRRFAGLRITNEPVSDCPSPTDARSLS